MILHGTKENFNEVINSNPVVIVDFWATWCGPCRMIASELEKLNDDSLVILKVNCDEEEELCSQFGVSSIPTLLYYKNGKMTNKTVGFMPASKIKENI